MAYRVGDICPQCKEGLVERTEFGYTCSECSWDMTVAEIVEANKREESEVGDYKYRPAKVSVRIETAEAGEEFLRGLIVARQNNNSALFVELIDAVNGLLEPYRAAALLAQVQARG